VDIGGLVGHDVARGGAQESELGIAGCGLGARVRSDSSRSAFGAVHVELNGEALRVLVRAVVLAEEPRCSEFGIDTDGAGIRQYVHLGCGWFVLTGWQDPDLVAGCSGCVIRGSITTWTCRGTVQMQTACCRQSLPGGDGRGGGADAG